jgi:hypothetical protein
MPLQTYLSPSWLRCMGRAASQARKWRSIVATAQDCKRWGPAGDKHTQSTHCTCCTCHTKRRKLPTATRRTGSLLRTASPLNSEHRGCHASARCVSCLPATGVHPWLLLLLVVVVVAGLVVLVWFVAVQSITDPGKVLVTRARATWASCWHSASAQANNHTHVLQSMLGLLMMLQALSTAACSDSRRPAAAISACQHARTALKSDAQTHTLLDGLCSCVEHMGSPPVPPSCCSTWATTASSAQASSWACWVAAGGRPLRSPAANQASTDMQAAGSCCFVPASEDFPDTVCSGVRPPSCRAAAMPAVCKRPTAAAVHGSWTGTAASTAWSFLDDDDMEGACYVLCMVFTCGLVEDLPATMPQEASAACPSGMSSVYSLLQRARRMQSWEQRAEVTPCAAIWSVRPMAHRA